ncbi:hypothetical protein TNCV_3302231 [Trichonephila clavipes]|nr:hypothetical protein TNCV_3302231 [Trichonephila clavipes]
MSCLSSAEKSNGSEDVRNDPCFAEDFWSIKQLMVHRPLNRQLKDKQIAPQSHRFSHKRTYAVDSENHVHSDATTCLSVSRSTDQRICNQFKSEGSVTRKQILGQSRVATPERDYFLAFSVQRWSSTTVFLFVERVDHFVISNGY